MALMEVCLCHAPRCSAGAARPSLLHMGVCTTLQCLWNWGLTQAQPMAAKRHCGGHNCQQVCAHDMQVLQGRSHALLQEAGVDLVQILREEGFYVQRRTMSAPVRSRSREAFGAAMPIELPTRIELDKLADK